MYKTWLHIDIICYVASVSAGSMSQCQFAVIKHKVKRTRPYKILMSAMVLISAVMSSQHQLVRCQSADSLIAQSKKNPTVQNNNERYGIDISCYVVIASAGSMSVYRQSRNTK
jgi:hypothetical protein